MKKLVSVLVLALFVVNNSYAQTTETLTNSIIIKMVKANLSDDLIISEINGSKVNFNVSTDSIKFLSNSNVSSRIIQAMKSAAGTQQPPGAEATTISASPQPATVVVKDTLKQTAAIETVVTVKEIFSPSAILPLNDTLNKPVKEQLKPETIPVKELQKEKIVTESNNKKLSEKSTVSVNAVGYVIHLEGLMIFFDNEFNSLVAHIKGWDQQIRNSIEKGNQIREKIREVEMELTDKKNADSRGFTPEIISLKKKLSEYRESYKQFENNMVIDGLRIVKEIDDIGSELDKSINKNFSDVSQFVKKTDPDPSVIVTPKSITIPRQKINENIVNHISPITEMLFCYQNQIISLRDIIELWNIKVLTINKKDAELSTQLEPLEKELKNLQLNAKANKEAISALKKQCTTIEKERKLLSRQMGTDSKELSGFLDLICKEAQSSVKERLSDIIENIKYSYQDNFTYRDI
jgi:predicted  nucleic acid-binding Zn-ribbon protein